MTETRGVIYDEKALPQNLIGRTPEIINKTLTLQNTEYSQALPARCNGFTIQARTAADIKLSFTSGESATKYITIKSGASYTEQNIDLTDATLYMQSPTGAGVVAEIMAWTF